MVLIAFRNTKHRDAGGEIRPARSLCHSLQRRPGRDSARQFGSSVAASLLPTVAFLRCRGTGTLRMSGLFLGPASTNKCHTSLGAVLVAPAVLMQSHVRLPPFSRRSTRAIRLLRSRTPITLGVLNSIVNNADFDYDVGRKCAI